VIPPRAIWRLLVLPGYIMLAGLVFALALRNTRGSIIAPLAALAPWVMVLAGVFAMVTVFGGVLRWRRRLAAVRRGRSRRGGHGAWQVDGAPGAVSGSGS